MNKWKKITAIVTGAFMAGLAIYDVWVIQKGGVYSSVSNTIWTWSRDYPLFTFGFGIICGHLFWGPKPIRHQLEDKKNKE